ncbi:Fmp27p PWA37_002414 [Arxiozyma heterogenica]|uniref:Fmp27p n=1 Tax=Arxiozyma heterogenica TaxID=278026 RepID=UPI002EF86BF2
MKYFLNILSFLVLIPKWLWIILILLPSLKYLLYILTGINITYFNPIKFKFGFVYKDIIEVKNIQIILLQRKIVVSGLNINKLPHNNDNNKLAPKIKLFDVGNDDIVPKTKKLINEIMVPQWVTNHYTILKFLFDDFRLALNHIYVKESNFNLVVLLFIITFSETKLSTNSTTTTNKISQDKTVCFDILIRGANLDNENVCTELYLTLKNKLFFQPIKGSNKSIIAFNDTILDMKFGKLLLPMKLLNSLKKDDTTENNRICKPALKVEKKVLQIIQKLTEIYTFTSLIEEINITMDRLIMKDYGLTTNKRIIEVNNFLSYHICASNLTFNMSRFKPGMPGYQLIFKDNDTPLKLSLTLSRFNICLCMKRQSAADRKLVKFLEIPSIYLFGETNIFSQKFKHDYGNTIENGILNLKGNISSPTFEIDIINLSFLKSFKKNIKVFKQVFDDPVKVTCGDDKTKSYQRNIMLSFFKSFLPLINMKITVDEPRFIINDNEDVIIMRLCTLLIIGTSSRTLCDSEGNCKEIPLISNNDIHIYKEDAIVYESHLNFELLELQMQHQVRGKSYKNIFFRLKSLTLQDYIKMNPQHIIALSGTLDGLDIDLSELPTMVMLNQIVKKLDCQMANVERNYFKLLYEKFASKIKTSEDKCSLLSRTFEEEAIDPGSFLFQALPQFFDYFKIDIKSFKILLGARSVFMPPDVFSSIESQSSHDLVDGRLRKFCVTMNQLEMALSGNYTQWKNKYDNTYIGMVKSGEISTYRHYDTDSLDDISTNESTEVGYLWSFNILVDDITCTVIGDAPDSTNELTARTVSRLSVLSVMVYPSVEGFETNQSKKIIVQISNKKVKSVLSLMNIFLVISGIHTLHQIFRISCVKSNHESLAKKYLMAIAQSQKKSCLRLIKWKDISSYLDITFGSETFNQILSFPNGLRAKIELFAFFMNIKNINNIELTGEYLRMCVESPTIPSLWERFILINKFLVKTKINELKAQRDMTYEKAVFSSPSILLQNESWHLSVPHSFELHKLIDNFSTVIKTLRQMVYSFKTSKNNLVIFPSETSGNAVPKIKLKSNRYIMSIMDDPFEAELNMIFQIGLQEQRERLVKIREFDDLSLKKLRTLYTIDTKRDETVSEVIKKKRLQILNYNRANGQKKTFNEPLIKTSFNIDGKANDRRTNLLGAITEEIEQYYDKLQANISTSWIRRIQSFRYKEKALFEKNFSFIWGNIDYSVLPQNVSQKLLDFSTYPFLSTLIMEDINVDICRPSCGMENISNFIYNVGKGVPKDTKYSIMIPFNINACFSEIRWHMRDYPLPFINIPPLLPSQSREKCTLQIAGDIIIAEDMIQSDHELRTIFVPLVPSIVMENTDEYYSLKVPRTVTSIKFFTDLKFNIYTKETTQVQVGGSYQPAIQQTMQCLENISKPPLDPSKKTGFWDKIRYLFHGRIQISWPCGGHFEVVMKGSKSPYKIGGDDAGFVLGFGGNVVLNVNKKEDPKEFLSCTADQLYFGIPNFFAKPLLVWFKPSTNKIFIPSQENTNMQRFASYYYMFDLRKKKDEIMQINAFKDAYIEKTAIKLTGGIIFNLGMVFERMVGSTSFNNRTFDSKPHYDIRLTNPIYVANLEQHDSYAGFRSEFIHMSFTLLSKTDSAYNAMQLSPATLDIFFKWWKTFSGNFPVRRGKLFNIQNNAPKFGEHIYSISYHTDTRPLFISYMVHNVDADRVLRKNFLSSIEYVGLKGKTGQFVMDLHQRKELLTTYNPTLGVRKRIKKLKFHEGKIIMNNIDVRTVHGKFRRLQYIEEKEDAKYDIFDNDMAWIDLTDFQEPFFVDIYKYLPYIYVRPFVFAPNFMYDKSASFGDSYQLDPVTYKPIKPFINSVSHNCVLNEEMGITTNMIITRIQSLKKYKTTVEKQLSVTTDTDKKQNYGNLLQRVQIGLKNLELLADDFNTLCNKRHGALEDGRAYNIRSMQILDRSIKSKSLFDNRFYIYHMLLKWNENIRNVLLKFFHYLTLANGFTSLSSRKSFRMFEDLIKQKIYEKEKEEKTNDESTFNKSANSINTINGESNESFSFSGKRKSDEDQAFDINYNDDLDLTENCIKLLEDKILHLPETVDGIIHRNNFIQFVIPQVQLTTEEDPDSCIIVTAPNIINKMISFEPKNDDVNIYYEERFLKRFGCIVNNANIFVLDRKKYKDKSALFFDLNSYGQVKGAEWPPWLGVELTFQNDLLSEAKVISDVTTVVQSQTLLPLSNNYEKIRKSLEDKLTIHLPRVFLTITSKNFSILYKIYRNLTNYEEPEKKELNSQIDKMAIGFNFNNYETILESVKLLYDNYDILTCLEKEFSFRRHTLDDISSIDFSNIHNERKNHLLRLYMLYQVLETGKTGSKITNYDEDKWHILRVKINEIRLKLLDNNRNDFIDINVNKLIFKKSDNINGLVKNQIYVETMEVLTLENNSKYEYLLRPYEHNKILKTCKLTLKGCVKNELQRERIDNPLVNIVWEYETPVGGIKVINNVNVLLSALKIQIEDEMVTKVVAWLNINSISDGLKELRGKDVTVDDNNLDKKFIEWNQKDDTRFVNKGVNITQLRQENGLNTELDEMVERSMNYMIIEKLVVNQFKLNISYHGHGKKRLINVTDFLFTFPKVMFENEVMKFIDIIHVLRKTLIRVILKHTGKFLGTKLKRRPTSKLITASDGKKSIQSKIPSTSTLGDNSSSLAPSAITGTTASTSTITEVTPSNIKDVREEERNNKKGMAESKLAEI